MIICPPRCRDRTRERTRSLPLHRRDLPLSSWATVDASNTCQASDCSTTVGCHDVDETRSTCSYDDVPAVETVVFCDWDDTLFPTTWLERQGLLARDATLSKEQKSLLQTMAGWAAKTLQMAMEFGNVVIVTNAQQGWVESSCAAFMPSLTRLLQATRIVSARSQYEKRCPNNPSAWKCLAFEQELASLVQEAESCEELNILSLGDSLHEQRALAFVTKGLSTSHGKSVKFMQSPTIGQLIDQHELLSRCFQDVAEHSGDLDVEVGADATID